MNIDEIKRNLNKRRTNLQAPPPTPAPVASASPVASARPQHPEHTTPSANVHVHSVNEIFTRTLEEEEEKEPQSEPWYAPVATPGRGQEDGFLDMDDVRRTISDLGLDEDQYDWRQQTTNGRKSRREFTEFLKMSL